MKVKRPPLRYFGGKWRDAPRILEHFPPHVCYVEPFCGGASLLFRKSPAPREYINDLDGDVVTFFRCLRDQTDALLWAIRSTPYSREEVAVARQPLGQDDPIEQSRRLAVRCWQMIGPSGGWRFHSDLTRRSSVASDWAGLPTWLAAAAERLKLVGIENRDAAEVVARFDSEGTLFYVDPPYQGDLRVQDPRAGYACDMRDEGEHLELAQFLSDVQGMVVLSGYQTAVYDCLESEGWLRVAWQSRTNGGPAEECLWINPAAQRANAPLFSRALEAS